MATSAAQIPLPLAPADAAQIGDATFAHTDAHGGQVCLLVAGRGRVELLHAQPAVAGGAHQHRNVNLAVCVHPAGDAGA